VYVERRPEASYRMVTLKLDIRTASLADLSAIRACVSLAYQPYVARIGMRPPSMDRDFSPSVAAGCVHVCEIDGTEVDRWDLWD
jgi:hypothetical protein